MKKAGIVTFHRAMNCGAMLQAYALQEVLGRRFDAYILDYRCEEFEYVYKYKRSIKSYIRFLGKFILKYSSIAAGKTAASLLSEIRRINLLFVTNNNRAKRKFNRRRVSCRLDLKEENGKNESNRHRQEDRRPRQSSHPQGDPPHHAYP